MRTFILACLLVLTAASATVVTTHPAAAASKPSNGPGIPVSPRPRGDDKTNACHGWTCEIQRATGLSRKEAQMLPGAKAPVSAHVPQQGSAKPIVQDSSPIRPTPGSGVMRNAAKVPASLPVARVSLDNNAPENSEPNAQVPGSIDLLRETERQQTLIAQLKPLLAQRAVLVAEHEAIAPVAPKQLIDLVGAREAERLIAAQVSVRAAAKAEIEAQDIALGASVEGIKRELVALHDRVVQIEANSSTKSDRLRLLQTANKGTIALATLGEARTAVAEVEDHRQEVLVYIAQAEQRLAQTQQERAKLIRHARTELEQALLTTEAQISQAAISLSTSKGVLAAMQQQAGAAAPAASAHRTHAPAPGTDL